MEVNPKYGDDVALDIQSNQMDEDVYVFPTSFAQQRLWFLDLFEPNSPFYNIPLAVRFQGNLKTNILERIINEIVRRHETLRTTFGRQNGEPVQIIAARLELRIPVEDLTALARVLQEEKVIELANRDARRPFNLSKGPLIRVTLLKLADDDHVMLLNMHHIISDGWSMGVFVREVAVLYDAFSNGKPSPLPELPIQYADFALWQQDWLKGEILDRQLEYWKKHLSGLTVLELPTDRPRPAVQTSRGANAAIVIPKPIADDFNALSRKKGVTLFMSLVAAFQTLLYRYTGQEDLSVGTPIANRTRVETEGLIGFFVNTLVLRANLSGKPTFSELLNRMREVTLGAYANQDIPFEQLVEALQPTRDMSHSPLFQVMFILQNTPQNVSMELTDLKLTQIDADAGTSTFDMTLMVTERTTGFHVNIEYNTDLFDAATMYRFLGHFQGLLQSIVANPDQSISRLAFLSDQEMHTMLHGWNDTGMQVPEQACAHHLIEAQVLQTPDAKAVAFQGTYLSYRELNERANQLAHYLQKIGVEPNVVVGICVERSLDMIVAVLAVLKAGGAYVPIDPVYPKDRIAYMIEDAGITILLTQTSIQAALPENNAEIVRLDADWRHVARESIQNPISQVTSDDLAYVIYTSGSTGKSKGTMVSHKSLVNAYLAWEKAYDLRPFPTHHLQMASFSFDVFTGDFVRGLCSGGMLVICPRDLLLDARALYALMIQEQINCAEFVPVVIRNLIEYLDETGQSLDFMQILIAASDVWYVGEYKRFLKFAGPNTRLINSFGLTETTIDSTFFYDHSTDLPDIRLTPIGRPFGNNQIYLLDADFMPAPPGVAAEIYIGGLGVSRGYLNRPDLTAEKFIPDPFSGIPGSRLYKTGDLARFLPDGNIEFLGRIDNQVKIRGFRIELGEIETALGKHPDVQDAVVIAREDTPGDKRLVAYIVPVENAVAGITELRAYLRDLLPDYMIPSAFVILASLPLLPNGKVDRRSLPVPDSTRSVQDENFVEPRTALEKQMAAVWGKLLNYEKVGCYDNFFELGGHSLLATQLVSRIRDVFQVDFPLRKVFETPVLADMTQNLEVLSLSGNGHEAPPLEPIPRDGRELPLSFAQQRLWFIDQLQPGIPFYNIPEVDRIKGDLKVDALQKALNEVIRRHESLRTTFSSIEGRPIQKIAPELIIQIPVIDLSDLPESEREAQALQLVTESVKQAFNLETGPLVRVLLIRLQQDEYIVALTLHHIISDGWSSGVMMQEIAVLYNAFAQKRPSPLPELVIQYADFSFWQRNWLKGQVLESQMSYWRQQLGGSPPVLELPTDHPRPAVQNYRGGMMSFQVSKEITAALNRLSQQEGATMFMTALAAFKILLYRYSGQNDISIGTPIANRTNSDLERLIGFFVNTLVLRTDLSGDPNFIELLARLRKMAVEAYAHQDVPFEMIVAELQPERNMSHTPLFQVMFVLQQVASERQRQKVGALILEPMEIDRGVTQFDLTLWLSESEDGMAGLLEYNANLFDESTIARMAGHFQVLLDAIVRDPAQRISAISLMSESEIEELVRDWNNTVAELPYNQFVHELFENQVANYPAAIAVRYQQTEVSYAELNGCCNQLARYLNNLGLGSDDLVGVCMERSPEMVIGLLGALKAGAAYVPLDPSYPDERLRYMIDDSGIKVLLIQERLRDQLPIGNCPVVCIDSEWEKIAGFASDNPHYPLAPNNLAYVIYTSGSTGRPKGTMITHFGLTNYLNWCIQAYPLDQGNGSLVHSTVAFDATITGLFAPLTMGRCVGLIPEGRDVEQLGENLRIRQDLSLVKITPAHLEILGHQLRPEEAAGLTRAFIIGGENLTAEQVRFWTQNAPKTALVNEYGPTETVVGCCVYWVPEQGIHSGSVPIGRPIINTQLYVLDGNLNPVPTGVPGELYIGGAGVARGYLNRPDLTAEKFIPDLFSATPGSRLYRTGDLVRHLADGNLEFLGRIDFQVKIRGYRIELAEIESVLAQHPNVREGIVLAREDSPGEKRLVAYVVASDATLTSAMLRDFLQVRLPEYMVPSAFVFLDAMPLTPNAKVDRRALPAPEINRDELQVAFVPPRNATEEKIVQIWTELLNIPQVGVFDSFFELGGHSLLATQLFSRLRKTFELDLPLQLIFEAPTIAGLAEKIAAAAGQSIGLIAPPLQRFARTPGEDFPLSFSQQRLWFLDQLEPGETIYNIPTALRFKGQMDMDALARSFDALIRRHESLRTTFAAQDGVPVQVINEAWEWQLEVIDLTAQPAEKREANVRDLVQADAVTAFDLARGPLLRVKLVKLAEDEHVLLFTMHHIISDGWSVGVFIREMATFYQSFASGRPAPLPELPIQYADYARWQREWLQGEVLQAQIDYWHNQLKDSPPLLELPTDRPRPPVKTFAGAQQMFQIEPELYQGLKALAQQDNVTLFMVLMAAFQTFLYRYSGQEDINVGTPIANRNRLETEGLIGFFVNTLVIRAKLFNNPTFRQVLHQTRDTSLGAYAHQEVPFEKLVEVIQPERNLSHTPLFQVMLVLQNTAGQSFELPSVSIQPVNAAGGSTQFDLTLSLIEGNGLVGSFEYNIDLFDASTINRMIGYLQNLLTAMVVNPDARVSALPLLPESELNQLLIEWNQTATDYPAFQEQAIHRLFEHQVARTPGKVAVEFDGGQLSYAGLNIRANQLAWFLRKAGVDTNVLVGISVEKNFQMIVGLLGILKAGGAYLPLDPSYPKDRLEFMIRDSGIKILLTQASLVDALPVTSARVVCLDTAWEQIAREKRDNPVNLTQKDDLAYVIYTSGSTGLPKGVMLRHRGLINLTQSQIVDFNVGETSHVLQFASFSFDASVSEIFMALLTGATLYLAKREILMSVPDLTRFLTENGITTVTLPPSILKLMPEIGLEKLTTVISAGESCSREIASRWTKGRCLLNAYGPTESTIGVACNQAREIPERAASVPIGRPISNTQLYLLDRFLNPVPVGVPGELYIGSIGLAVGYMNRPDLTAEKFIPNPFSSEPGIRLYRSGDLLRHLPDGSLEFLGRIDHQVKVRGFRIELGEIEAVLSQHALVQEVVVLAREIRHQAGEHRLVAYLVFKQLPSPDVAELRAFVLEKLPEYMVPSVFVPLEEMPLTPNGKVDRKALPEPEALGLDIGTVYVAPRNATEELLADIWRQFLGVERIGVNDNFFELGGHSLLATQLVSRIREVFQVELPIRAIFDTPTIGTQALTIANERQIKSGLTVVNMAAVDRNQPLPLSFAQERLWFLEQLEPGNVIYNITDAVKLVGELNPEALAHSLNAVIARHETLRTFFARHEGLPVQVIAAEVRLDVPKLDLRHLSEAERQTAAVQLAEADAQKPFDLTQAPLLRAQLVQMEEKNHVFILTMHHIVSDGWSVGILIREIATFYNSFVHSEVPALAPLSIQYADFAAWQRQWLQGEVLEKQLGYWQRQLAEVPPLLELPTDRPRPSVKTFNGAREVFELSSELTGAIKTLGQAHGSTIFMTLLAAFQTLLYRYSGQDQVSVGTPIANRNRLETEGLIGFFVNTLVMNADFSRNSGFIDLLHQVRETALAAYAHQDVPFEKIVEALKPERDLSHTPLFQVMFVLQNAPMGGMALPGLNIESLNIERNTTQFDLTLSMQDSPAGLLGTLEYNTDLFNRETIQRMLRHFQSMLEGITANPEQRVGLLPLLTESEIHQVLRSWNDTEQVFPDLTDGTIQQIFSRQAHKTPKSIAAVFEDKKYTYQELDQAANQLAHYLISQGVEPNSFVGICMDRSTDIALGILGILKAGAAFVPLDPYYPKDRLDFMIQDSEIQILLTQKNLAELMNDDGLQLICLDSDWNFIQKESKEQPPVRSGADAPVYMIYTSGSTGTPKGVMLRQRGLVNLTHAQIQDFGVKADSRVLQFASFSFDAAVSEIFMALLSGATLYFARRETLLSPFDLLRLLHEQEISIVTLPPSMLNVLPTKELPALQTIISAGEACSHEIAVQWSANNRLINAYGPTEATIGVTSYLVQRIPENTTTIPIGKPILNTQLYILDAWLNPVPPGVAGELYIGGVGLAIGYRNRPDLTAERFVPNPFGVQPGSRLYRTGDRVRSLPEGNIEFLSRIDYQVKVRGYRIELGEIEALLSQHPSIQESLVLARETESGSRDKQIVAYIVQNENDSTPVAEIRDFLKEKLPDYMIPSAFIELTAMPLTPNGKIDRKALPAPEIARLDQKREYIEPRDTYELQLAQIWEDILHVKPIGVTDNFFELGGHSLMAIHLLAKIQTQFNREIPLFALFQEPTIERLASILKDDQELSSAALVKFKDTNEKSPLFFVHPSGGSVHWYADLAQSLAPDQPFYGLQAKGNDGREEIQTRIEDMAAYFVRSIRARQPKGPYHIGSWSMGVIIVYEMAQLLVAQREQVGSLIILDQSPFMPKGMPKDDAEFLAGMFGQRLTIIPEDLRPFEYDEQVKILLKKAKKARLLSKFIRFEQFKNYVHIIKTQMEAWNNYKIKPFPGKVLLFKSLERYADYPEEPDLGWGKLAQKGVEIIQVPGNHNTMLHGDNVKILADKIQAYLSEDEKVQS